MAELDLITVLRETDRTRPGIRPVVEAAFGQKGEADLVDDLRAAGALVLSLVAVTADERVVGHLAFSPVTLETGSEKPRFVARGLSLAPLAVHPDFQRKGIGAKLCEIGLTQLAAEGHDFCILLGHPAYYPRFGFQPAFPLGFDVDFPVPEEQRDAFMIREFRENALSGRRGRIVHHAVFDQFK